MMVSGDTDIDFSFVEEPQELSAYDCPVCLQVLVDPRKSQCCKKVFCRACLVKIRRSGGDDYQCPMCRHLNFAARKDHALSRELYSLQVYCGNRSKGCEWVGNFGELQTHLNLKPASCYLANGCQFVNVRCSFCSESYQRCAIIQHSSECPKRPYCCEYCQQYDSCYEDVRTQHWPVCQLFPVLCPNSCGEYIPRRNKNEHIADDCSMTLIECEFKSFGCKERLPRREMSLHMKYSVAAHESLKRLGIFLKQLNKQEERILKLKTKLKEMHKNFVTEQKALFEKNVSVAISDLDDTLRSIHKKVKDLESVERRLNKMDPSSAIAKCNNTLKEVNQKARSLEGLENRLTKRDTETNQKLLSLQQQVTSLRLGIARPRLVVREWQSFHDYNNYNTRLIALERRYEEIHGFVACINCTVIMAIIGIAVYYFKYY